MPKPVVLCILDGWGYREELSGNAISSASIPHWQKLWKENPHTLLETSGGAVGLPEGQMGNSEVGHMNIGSGRVVLQDLPRIDKAIEEGDLAKNPELVSFIAALKRSSGVCHLMGLVSDGGVHAHIGHIIALARMVSDAGIKVAIHAFLDGRDTPPQSAGEYIVVLQDAVKGMQGVTIATVSGRYYAMDRDKRWDRVERAYNALVNATGIKEPTALGAIQNSYKENKGDEFVLPAVLEGYEGMRDGDGLLMANFRADRARQILAALLDPEFTGFARVKTIRFETALGMVEYSQDLNRFLRVLFPPETLSHILGEVISQQGMRQLRLAETEKYAHVTFFFNGGREEVFDGEDRILVPSPKVATYDLQPEMSAPEVTDRLVQAIDSKQYDLIVVNYANTDMVGHTGNMEAAVKAVETVDAAIGRIADAVAAKSGILLVTADHGNAEMMVNPSSGKPHTAHTTGPVPLVVLGVEKDISLASGRLCDIAPTILKLMDIPQPKEMTGKCLIQ